MSRSVRSAAFLRRLQPPGSAGPAWTSALVAIAVSRAPGRRFELELLFEAVSGGAAPHPVIPPGITPANVVLLTVKGFPEPDLEVLEVRYPEDPRDPLLAVSLRDLRPDAAALSLGDPPPNVLVLEQVAHLEPGRDQAAFLLETHAPEQEDCQPHADVPVPPEPAGPEINYLGRDYVGLRQLMLDQLAQLLPEWPTRNPADMLVAVVETLAASADQLSYYQDAVATEGYLQTARRRVSVRRLARLVDYRLGEGCNARVWVAFTVSAAALLLPGGTPIVTRVAGQEGSTRDPSDPAALRQALAQGALVFETVSDAQLSSSCNVFQFYVPPGAVPWLLPRGATAASLATTGGLRVGDVLILEELLGPATGRADDADPEHRHAVRLTRVAPAGFTLVTSHDGTALLSPTRTDVEWAAEDRLPFDLWVTSLVDGVSVREVSVAYGNVAMADQGRSIAGEPLVPESAPEVGEYRPVLAARDPTHREPPEAARLKPASLALLQDPAGARPQIALQQDVPPAAWQAVPDLLESGPFDRHFVVELESDRRATLRFGDGVLGRRPAPGTRFLASYRSGNGASGNVGAGALAQVLTSLPGIAAVRNPLPAMGGVDPEPLEHAKLYAPQAYRLQQRAVNAADWKAIAERHPDVQAASAEALWTGSGYTFVVAIDRYGGRPVDRAFEAQMLAFLDGFRQAGAALSVRGPQRVPVEIALVAYAAPGYAVDYVRRQLAATFGDGLLPDGRPAFFNPDNFTFAQPVYLSQVIGAAAAVPGVSWIDSDPRSDPRVRFRRWGEPPAGELEVGEIPMGPLEIACAASDPARPDQGSVSFYVVVER